MQSANIFFGKLGSIWVWINLDCILLGQIGWIVGSIWVTVSPAQFLPSAQPFLLAQPTLAHPRHVSTDQSALQLAPTKMMTKT